MSLAVASLLFGWDKNEHYAQQLVADLTAEQMVAMPVAGVNHPAWVLSHLCIYHPAIIKMCRGQPFDDPKDLPFGMMSAPVADVSVYDAKDALLERYIAGHHAVKATLETLGDEVFKVAQTLKRWQKPMPTAGLALGYLLQSHESTHLGQLSAWRRFQGLPSV